MAFLKKPAAEQLHIPSKSEAHPGYKLQDQRLVALNDQLRSLRDEDRRLVAAIESDESPALRPGVAILLGEKPSPKLANQARLREVRSLIDDVDEAIGIAAKLRNELETAASVAVFNQLRPEISKRMSALLQALAAVEDARRGVDDIVLAIEAEGAETALLSPLRTEPLMNQIGVFKGQARGAGYVG